MKQFLILIISALSLFAQIPDGYYDGTSGLTGTSLQQALHDIIDGHTEVTYTALWTHYQTTDVKPNGKVWDMYSDVPGGTPAYEYTFVTDQCGNYSGEGSCYNREHSWPKSWFNDATPMYTDIFHVVPTDGTVNGRRSNYPYGEVVNTSWESTNGSKLGSNDPSLGYSGTVFEPIDEYKGDFARIYFYMSTRYYGEDGSWDTNDMVTGSQLKPWALNMMLEWHVTDMVSQKEIDRNNAIYGIQHNRNPFVDHPEFSNSIWGGNYPVSIQYEPEIKPKGLELVSTYPNPFNAGTLIEFQLNASSLVAMDVFNIQGQLVSHILERSFVPGSHQIHWSGADQNGNDLSSGVYLLRLSSATSSSFQRLTILR
ncbi:MAG: endonuclease [Candidatus Marinimicrobia bacterium]|nr:endonuclease [Candidatus Neomarinimicrobiota bacterium]